MRSFRHIQGGTRTLPFSWLFSSLKRFGNFCIDCWPATQVSRTIWMNRGFPVHFYSFHHTNNLHYSRLLSPDFFFLILTFWFKLLLICAEEVRRELQDWVSTCVKHAGGFVWFGAAFQSVLSEIFPEFMENTDFDRPTQSGKCLIDSGFIFYCDNYSKHCQCNKNTWIEKHTGIL